MRKRTLVLLSILLLLTLCACGVNSDTDTHAGSLSIHPESAALPEATANISPTIDLEQRRQVTLDINANSKNKIIIPDPTKITEL